MEAFIRLIVYSPAQETASIHTPKQILGRRGRSPPGAVFPRTGESALPRLNVSGKLPGS